MIIDQLKKNWLLLVIVIAAFGLRAYGIYFDYPVGVNHIWDEIFSVSWLLDALEQKTIFTATPYQYPLLLPLLYLPGLFVRFIYLALVNYAYSIDALKQLLILGGMGQLFIIVRWYSVIFGTAGVFLIYVIFREVFKRRGAGLAAASAYAVAFIPVYMAHWGKTHTVMVFFVLLSIWSAIKFESVKKNKWAYLCAVAAAGAFCIHYIGIFAVIIPFCLWFWNRREFDKKTVIKTVLLGVIICLIFYGSNLIGLSGIWHNNVGYLQSGGSAGMGHAGLFERFYYLFRDTFKLDPVLLLVGVAALILGGKKLFKDKAGRYVLVAIFGNWLLMSTVIAWPQMSRWLLVFASIFLPLGLAWMWSWLSLKIDRKVAVTIIILMLIPSLYIDYRWLNFLNTNTRLETEKWLENNLNVEKSAYTFDMYLDTSLSYDAAIWHLNNNNRGASKKLKYIAEHPENFKEGGVNLYYDYGYNRYQSLSGTSTDYIIVSYWKDMNQPGILPSGSSRADAEDILSQVKRFHEIELVEAFYPSNDLGILKSGIDDYLNNPLDWQIIMKLKSSGPFVEIYKIIK